MDVLNNRQIRFCHAVAEGKADVTAYLEAGYSPNGAAQGVSRLLKEVEITAEIEHWRQVLAANAALSPDWVLNQWRMIAEADPDELIKVRVCCCRHCWGVGGKYQWRESEYLRAVLDATSAKEPRVPPAADGGFGFNATLEPNPNCPECDGVGVEVARVADTKNLKGSAKRLYAGVKQTKDGVQVLLRDQDAATKNIAQYLGMLVSKVESSGPGGAPIATSNVTLTAKDFTEEQLAAMIDKHTSA